jgi:serine/threonine-protein kinase
MSPEQFNAEPVDLRTDIYCFGILAFEVLAGRFPDPATTYQAMANSHLLDPLPIIADGHTPDIPNWVDEVMQMCTQKAPAHRYQSMDEVLDDLNRDRRGVLARFFARSSGR